MGADRKRNAGRTVRAGKLSIILLAAAFVLAGCGGSTETVASDVKTENRELSQENERLEGEVEKLQGEVGRLRGKVEDARETAGAEAPAMEPTTQEEGVREAEPEGSPGGALAVAGPGEVEGEELPEAMPEDFPIPAGAVVDYASEMGYNFVIDSDFETTTGFYYEQLAAQGWKETDRTEGAVERLEGAETSWERGTFIPEGSPDDPGFAQAKETMTLEAYEIEPSGVAVEVFWTDFERLNKGEGSG